MVEMMVKVCFLGLAAAVFTCWEGPGTAEVQGVFGCQPNTEVLFLFLHQKGGCSWMSSSFIAVKCQNAMNDEKFWFCITRCPADIEVETYTTLRTIAPVSVCNEGVASTRFQSKASFSLP
jgi:hypothetical protein